VSESTETPSCVVVGEQVDGGMFGVEMYRLPADPGEEQCAFDEGERRSGGLRQ
jgi:hypothetical protein